jgi:hypothetical protein
MKIFPLNHKESLVIILVWVITAGLEGRGQSFCGTVPAELIQNHFDKVLSHTGAKLIVS